MVPVDSVGPPLACEQSPFLHVGNGHAAPGFPTDGQQTGLPGPEGGESRSPGRFTSASHHSHGSRYVVGSGRDAHRNGKGHAKRRRFSVRLIEASLCVFLSLSVSLTGLFLGILYQPILLVVFVCGMTALAAYLCYGLVLYKRSRVSAHSKSGRLIDLSRNDVSVT